MSSKPSQIRSIDPFAEYNSNVANRLTRMLTQNDNVLLSANSLSLTLDSTSPLSVAVVQTGTVFKDDVLIEIIADHRVDFTDSNNYISGGGATEVGYYYVCLEYTYVKSRPAPDVDIKILKPSERGSYTTLTSLLLIGVVKFINTGGPNIIDLSDPFHNFDPENTTNRREYVKFYAGTESNLPIHTSFRDQSRLAYDSETDKFWLGYQDSWQEFGTGGSIINIDTTGTTVGQLCYVDSTGNAIAAIADDLTTGADIAIKSVGLSVDSSGKALTSGIAEDVPIETAIVITTGDLLYLSDSEAGKITNSKTSPFYQVVGRALTSGDSANPIDIIFTPKLVLAEAVEGQITGWTGPDGDGLYYHDINIEALEVRSAVISQFYDDATDFQIVPAEVEIRDTGDLLRVYFSVNTLTVNYIIAAGGSGGGGGGGGGSTDHSLLLNLGYGASGHTGFAPSPHGNGDHSLTFIESAGVTEAALTANGDIGVGSSQVSQGNHDHSITGGGSIPATTVMLFGQAAAPVGWTKKTTGFTTNAMIVVSTGAGAGQGGSADARAYDPSVAAVSAGSHSHTTGDHTLTIAEMPAHTHPPASGYSNFMCHCNGYTGSSGDKFGSFGATGSTGGGGSHNHGSTSLQANHNHTINYDSYDPYYFTVIAATKD